MSIVVTVNKCNICVWACQVLRKYTLLNTGLLPDMELFMRTIYVYVPTIGQGWQRGSSSGSRYHFPISKTAAAQVYVSVSSGDRYPRSGTEVKWRGFEKCGIVDNRLSGVIS